MADLGIGVVGAAGRMGAALVRRIAATEGGRLAAAIERPGHPALGRDAGAEAGVGALGIRIGEDARALFAAADVVIEFSSPEATAAHAGLAGETGTAHVVGTTGLDEAQAAALRAAAQSAAVVWAPNMSVGVNALLALTERLAAVLDESYDIEIVEMHHRHKVDAPSGTALALGRAAAKGRGVDLDAVSARARDGVTGPRRRGDIGFAVLRGGDVVGDHMVVFAADGERVELGHRAASREVFAAGAVRAALWTKGRPPGLYGMREVLGLDA
jgi:4-hydroxy-tetrahydrodipicolinate reductase